MLTPLLLLIIAATPPSDAQRVASLCSHFERIACSEEVLAFSPASRLTLVVAMFQESEASSPAINSIFTRLQEVPAPQRLAFVTKELSTLQGRPWSCPTFVDLWESKELARCSSPSTASEPQPPSDAWQQRCESRFEQALKQAQKAIPLMKDGMVSLNESGVNLMALEVRSGGNRKLQAFISLKPEKEQRPWTITIPEDGGPWEKAERFSYLAMAGQKRQYSLERKNDKVRKFRAQRFSKLVTFISADFMPAKDVAAFLKIARPAVDDCLASLP